MNRLTSLIFLLTLSWAASGQTLDPNLVCNASDGSSLLFTNPGSDRGLVVYNGNNSYTSCSNYYEGQFLNVECVGSVISPDLSIRFSRDLSLAKLKATYVISKVKSLECYYAYEFQDDFYDYIY